MNIKLLKNFNLYPIVKARLKDLNLLRGSKRYILKRFAREGLPFLTKVLPTLSKHILFCIENGGWVDLETRGLHGFSLRPSILGRLPDFLFGEIESIFLGEPDESAHSLWVVREVCEYLYKLALPYCEEDIDLATAKFIDTDQHLVFCKSFADKLRKKASEVFPELYREKSDFQNWLGFVDTSGTFSGINPGGSARQEKDLLLGTYPKSHNAFKGLFRPAKRTIFEKTLRLRQNGLRPNDSEVLFVSKDSRGPRTIVRESYYNLGPQMYLHNHLRRYLQHKTKGRIQFDDQSKFNQLAKDASISKRYCTLDLESASDRVSYALVDRIFQHTGIKTHLRKFRSTHTLLPDGRRIKLNKLAGMGSGYTFPIMAMLIYLTCLVVGVPPSHCYVYGDDIIIPTAYYSKCVKALDLTGLKVNTAKSYYRSHFRESCGGDYLHGINVTPTRLKLSFCSFTSRNTVLTPDLKRKNNQDSFLLKLERHARVLVKNGFINTADAIYNYIGQFIPLPKVSGDSPLLGRYTLKYRKMHTNKNGNHINVFGYIPVPVKTDTKGYGLSRNWMTFLKRREVTPLERLFVQPPMSLFTDDHRYRVSLKFRVIPQLITS